MASAQTTGVVCTRLVEPSTDALDKIADRAKMTRALLVRAIVTDALRVRFGAKVEDPTADAALQQLSTTPRRKSRK